MASRLLTWRHDQFSVANGHHKLCRNGLVLVFVRFVGTEENMQKSNLQSLIVYMQSISIRELKMG